MRIITKRVAVNSASFFHCAQQKIFACFFDLLRKSFICYDFDAEKEIVFEREEFKEIHGEKIWSNFVTISANSHETKFLAAIEESRSGKLYLVLFTANFLRCKIFVISETEIYPHMRKTEKNHKFYLHKSENGCVFVISFWQSESLKTTGYVLSKIHVSNITEPLKLTCQIVSSRESFGGIWGLPFVEKNILYFLSTKEKNKIFKIPLDGTETSTDLIKSNYNDNQLSVLGDAVGPVAAFKGQTLFCSVSNDKKTSALWSLNLRKLLLTCEEQFRVDEFSLMQHPVAAFDGAVLFLVAEKWILQINSSMELQYRMSSTMLGEGGYGIVMKGKLSGHGDVAIKISEVPRISSKREHIFFIAETEAKQLKSLDHPHIVKAFAYKREEHRFLLFMELMWMSVREKLLTSQKHCLDEREALQILQQALTGLVYLHKLPKPIIHRDIKCDNFLIDRNGVVKLGDFGLLKEITLNVCGFTDPLFSSFKTEGVGTIFWKAPETLDMNENWSRKVDVWSIGCALTEMLTGLPPYAFKYPRQEWENNLVNGTLTYKPEEFLPHNIITTCCDSVAVLKKAFIRQTKKLNNDMPNNCVSECNQSSPSERQVRPHSWELLADVIEMNELVPLKKKIDSMRSLSDDFED